MNRRHFLSTAAAGVALAPAAAADVPAYDSQKLRRVALIGSGWYGKCDVLRMAQIANVEVVSLCDVDKQMLEKAADLMAARQKSKKRPRTYTDYRELLKQKDVDIAFIATPDHWHALSAIDAIKAGCDLYLQKPISVDVVEGQAILAAARKYNRVVQVGTQRRSTPHLIEARDTIIKEGKLGRVGLVEIYCYYHMRRKGNPPEKAAPDYLDWNAWTGPAPLRPYNALAHPGGWRSFKEYGNGIVGDMCIHMLDMTRWMMDLGWPKSIVSTGGILVEKEQKANIPDTQSATFDFGDTKVNWTHRTWGAPPDPKWPWAATLYGEKGTLKASVFGYEFTPMERGAKPLVKEVTYELEQYPEDKTEERLEKHVAPAIRRHMQDLLAAIDKRGRPVADVEQGHISTASCIMANLSLELGGRLLRWDEAKGQLIGDAEANKMLRRTYRAPYVHPEPAKV